ncbi:hypothetical protein K8I61_20465 [bacterium]|nr:hypothetical protein [bacterium]
MPAMKCIRARVMATLWLAVGLPAPALASAPGDLAPTFSIEWIDGFPVPFQSGVPLPDFDPQDHDTLDLSGTWKRERVDLDHDISFGARDADGIAALEAEAAGRFESDYDDSAWATRELPGHEGDLAGDESGIPEGYHGGVWYRRAIDVPADFDEVVRLVCLGANYITDLWVNGEWAGVHEGGDLPFAFDVTPHVVPGEQIVFAIRIDKPFPGARQDAIPAWFLMDWWSYTGVLQDIYLESLPAVHIVRADVRPVGRRGLIDVRIVVANSGANAVDARVGIEALIADRTGGAWLGDPRASAIAGEAAVLSGGAATFVTIPPGGVRVVHLVPRIEDVALWTPNEPNLYVLRSTLEIDGALADERHNQFGVRTVDAREGKMFVNDRVAFFPGVARHEEWPDTGRTATFERIRDDLDVILDLNAIFLRTGHYPNHPYTYLLTDRMGLAVWTELPVYWMMGWNWGYQTYRRVPQQMFREMVFMGLSRPSILVWGTMNECPFVFTPQIRDYNASLIDDHAAYDDGRIVSQSPAADLGWQILAATVNDLDLAGWTMYYGVFYDDDPYADTLAFVAEHQARFPDVPMVATEFGYWSEADDSEAQKQKDVFDDTWVAFAEIAALTEEGEVNPDGILAGTSWWTAFNWFTKNGLPEFFATPLQSMGLIHMDRTTWKPAANALAAAYAPYRAFGGLGPMPPDDDVDDDTTDDDMGDDDSGNADDDDYAWDGCPDCWNDDDDDDDGGCGCGC